MDTQLQEVCTPTAHGTHIAASASGQLNFCQILVVNICVSASGAQHTGISLGSWAHQRKARRPVRVQKMPTCLPPTERAPCYTTDPHQCCHQHSCRMP